MRNTIICLTLAFLPLRSSAQTEEQSNKHFWNTLKTSAAPEKIWAIWTDVAHWKDWDSGLKDATLEGPFELNAKGNIISLENQTSKFKVTGYVPRQSYTFKTKLPFGALHVKRYLKVKQGSTFFTHEVWFTGLTSGVFAKRFGPEFRKLLPEVMQQIKILAEK